MNQFGHKIAFFFFNQIKYNACEVECINTRLKHLPSALQKENQETATDLVTIDDLPVECILALIISINTSPQSVKSLGSPYC